VLGGGAVLAACDPPPPTTVLEVTTTVDAADATPGDGVCEATTGLGDCTLRAAIEEAGATPMATPVRIEVPSDTYPLTFGPLEVDRPGGSVPVMAEAPGALVDAQGATTGIEVAEGALHATWLGVTGATGDGIAVAGDATVGLVWGSLHGNGGAGLSIEADGHATLGHATVSSNGAGGIAGDGSSDLTFVTVTANDGGGIVGAGAWQAHGSIVADQASGADCATAAGAASTGNVVGDWSCLGGGSGNDVASGLGLKPLSGDLLAAHRPGLALPVVVDALAPGTAPCAETGPATIDQLGAVRPQGAGCDRGAVERPPTTTTVDSALDEPDLVPGDGVCASASGVCTLRAAVEEEGAGLAGGDVGELAIEPGIDPVLTLGPLDLPVGLIVTGNGATIDVGGDVGLRSTGATEQATLVDLTLAGGGPDGVLQWTADGQLDLVGVTAAGNVGCAVRQGGADASIVVVDSDLDGLCIAGGRATVEATTIAGDLMAEVNADESDALVVLDTTVEGAGTLAGGTARVGGSVFGGGLLVTGEGWVDVVDSTVDGDLTIANTTWAQNTWTRVAVTGHTAISSALNVFTASTLAEGVHIGEDFEHRFIASTITTTDSRPALSTRSLRMVLHGSIVHSQSGPACDLGLDPVEPDLFPGPDFTSSWNVVADESCYGVEGPGDQTSVDPLLGPLADNGGPTPTRLPAATSPAVDAIALGTTSTGVPSWALCGGALQDQRGVARPQGPACDIGAVER
jgi:CSLREA domain-containing protein